MKLKITKSERVIWSAETREVCFDMNGTELVVRQYEDDNGSETWVRVGDGDLIRDYEVEDQEIVTIVNKLLGLFRSGDFDEEGVEIETDELEEW